MMASETGYAVRNVSAAERHISDDADIDVETLRAAARAVAKLTAVVVFPTPPF